MNEKDWRVQVEGHQFDIEELRDLLEPSGFVVDLGDDNMWFVGGPNFDTLETPSDVRERARKLLEGANAVLQLSRSDYRPVTIGSTIKGGKSTHTVILAGSDELRLKSRAVAVVTRSDGTVEKSPPPYARERRWLDAAATDSAVQAVLDLMNSDKDHKLYRAFERIRDDLGGKAATRRFMGIGRERYSKFTSALNAPRHERDVTISMSFEEAGEIARQLIHKWLDKKAND